LDRYVFATLVWDAIEKDGPDINIDELSHLFKDEVPVAANRLAMQGEAKL